MLGMALVGALTSDPRMVILINKKTENFSIF